MLVWRDLCAPPGGTQLLPHCQHSLAALHFLLDSLPVQTPPKRYNNRYF